MTEEEKNKFLNELESWKGTKWMHGVALKGYRVDCVHFIVEVAKVMGWAEDSYQLPVYQKNFFLHTEVNLLFEKEIVKYCFLVQESEINIGDLLQIKCGRTTGHYAFYLGDGKIIHAQYGIGVVEDYFNSLKPYLLGIWRFKKNE